MVELVVALAFALFVLVAHKIVDRSNQRKIAIFWERMDEVRSLRKTGLPPVVEYGPRAVRRVRHTDPFIRVN